MSSAPHMDKTRRWFGDGSAKLAAIKTNIPARLDRLPWCRFHVLIIVALGVTWILDGLEVTIVGSIGPVLQDLQTLALSAQQIGAAASSYVVGAVCGALIFGWLTDRFGRKFVFYVTLIVYLLGVLLTAVSWNFWSFAAFRAITGMGIGGQRGLRDIAPLSATVAAFPPTFGTARINASNNATQLRNIGSTDSLRARPPRGTNGRPASRFPTSRPALLCDAFDHSGESCRREWGSVWAN